MTYREAGDVAAILAMFVAAVEVAVVRGVHGEVHCAFRKWCEDRVIGQVWCGGLEVGLEFLAEG